GSVEGGGGRRCVLEAEAPVAGELGASHRRAPTRGLAVDPHSASRRSVDATLDEAVRVGSDRDTDRRPGGGVEPLEPAGSRDEELIRAVPGAHVSIEPAVDLG